MRSVSASEFLISSKQQNFFTVSLSFIVLYLDYFEIDKNKKKAIDGLAKRRLDFFMLATTLKGIQILLFGSTVLE